MCLWLVAIIIFGGYWFGLALIVNRRARTSASCAVSLMIGWFMMAILLPGAITLAASLSFPVPSRTEFVNARRSIAFDLLAEEHRATERARQFLREHPALPSDYTYDAAALSWMDAAQRSAETEKRMGPVKDRFDGQVQLQRRMTAYLSAVSPLTVMQQLLPEISGTGRRRYESFLSQVRDFQARWRALFWTKAFFQQRMASVDYDAIPRFRFREASSIGLLSDALVPMLILATQVAIIHYLAWRRLGGLHQNGGVQ